MKKIILITIIFTLSIFTSTFVKAGDTNGNINFNQEVEKYFQKMTGTSSDYLIGAVQRASKPVKVACIRKLGDMKTKESSDFLVSVLTYIIDPTMYNEKYSKNKNITPDFDDDVRAEAAIALGKINDDQALKSIGNALLADRSDTVKIGCMKGLAFTMRKEAVDYIDNYLSHELKLNKNDINNEVMQEGINSLGQIGDKSAFFILVDITQSDNLTRDTRMDALRALEKIKF